MQRITDYAYHVYPSYGAEYEDFDALQECYRSQLLDRYSDNLPLELFRAFRFWPGFKHGGVVAILRWINEDRTNWWAPEIDGQVVGTSQVYGTQLGNEVAMSMQYDVTVAHVDRPPAIAVRFGAEKVPEPTVGMTIEHVDSLQPDEKLLLIVPKLRRKSVKLIEQLPEWYHHFGVQLSEPAEISDDLRDEISGWFDDPERRMYVCRYEGGEDDACWHFAVLAYIGEYWDVHAGGLDTLHLLANIDDKPNTRQYWTSRR